MPTMRILQISLTCLNHNTRKAAAPFDAAALFCFILYVSEVLSCSCRSRLSWSVVADHRSRRKRRSWGSSAYRSGVGHLPTAPPGYRSRAQHDGPATSSGRPDPCVPWRCGRTSTMISRPSTVQRGCCAGCPRVSGVWLVSHWFCGIMHSTMRRKHTAMVRSFWPLIY